MFYHVTPIKNLQSIRKFGLIPQIGNRSTLICESSECVYMFTTRDACTDALMNWLGDELEGVDIVILEIDSTGIIGDVDVGYEISCKHQISANKIIRVLDENFKPLI